MQVNLIITSMLNDEKSNTTVSYVNPDVANSKLTTLAESLIELTDHTYVKTVKETKEEL